MEGGGPCPDSLLAEPRAWAPAERAGILILFRLLYGCTGPTHGSERHQHDSERGTGLPLAAAGWQVLHLCSFHAAYHSGVVLRRED